MTAYSVLIYGKQSLNDNMNLVFHIYSRRREATLSVHIADPVRASLRDRPAEPVPEGPCA